MLQKVQRTLVNLQQSILLKIQYSAEAEICTYLHRIIDRDFSVPVSPAFLLGKKSWKQLNAHSLLHLINIHKMKKNKKNMHTTKKKRKKRMDMIKSHKRKGRERCLINAVKLHLARNSTNHNSKNGIQKENSLQPPISLFCFFNSATSTEGGIFF